MALGNTLSASNSDASHESGEKICQVASMFSSQLNLQVFAQMTFHNKFLIPAEALLISDHFLQGRNGCWETLRMCHLYSIVPWRLSPPVKIYNRLQK